MLFRSGMSRMSFFGIRFALDNEQSVFLLLLGNCETLYLRNLVVQHIQFHKQVLWSRWCLHAVLWHVMHHYERQVAQACQRWIVYVVQRKKKLRFANAYFVITVIRRQLYEINKRRLHITASKKTDGG